MTILDGTIITLFTVAIVILVWKNPLRQVSHPAADGLRNLLLQRAEGKLSAEEFERAQAALYAELLQPSQPVRDKNRMFFAFGVALALLAVALFAWSIYSRSVEVQPVKSTTDMSSLLSQGGGPGIGNIVSGGSKTLKTSPQNLSANQPMAGNAADKGKEAGDLGVLVGRLAEKMKDDPKNGEGWLLLARTYGELRKHAEAAAAYEKAAALVTPSATLFADWADAYVMSHDRRWDKTSRDILKRALALDRNHLKTLALSGSEAFDRGDYKSAIEYWNQMRSLAPKDSMDVKLAEENIREANKMLGASK